MKKLLLFAVTLLAFACSDKKPVQVDAGPSAQMYVPAVSGDSVTREQMAPYFPLVDELFRKYAQENHFPSVAYAIVRGNEVVYAGSTGQSNLENKTPTSTKALYRIASMSKSFTAMSILKLRDEGKLQLTDPVAKYIPEMTEAGLPTKDSAPITIQNLLTMSAGFPEDNPWGDRQLADTDEELLKLLKGKISFSNVPGVQFEYSNLGFALLGKIITNISGMPYQRYITEQILKPLGMNTSLWEYASADPSALAKGYRWEEEQWKEEPLLHDGSYGAMGGLICTIEDFSKYVSLHLSAWPPRDDEETGPVRRSSIREMQQPWRFGALSATAKLRTGESCPVTSGYGYGLGWRKDCKGVVRVSHGGGLPGFGSDWRIYPDYNIGIVSFSNRTYGGTGFINSRVMDTLIHLTGMAPRAVAASAILQQRKEEIVKILPGWSEGFNAGIFAENFFDDQSVELRRKDCQSLFEKAGKVLSIGEIKPENQLRGTFVIHGEKKDIQVFFTLTPEAGALVQELDTWIN
ncbi:MAG: serine hydrolase domain-containing protein [Cyclobacteriaceae bacterium]